MAQHVSDLTGPSSGAFYKLYVADLVCGNTRTTRHVSDLTGPSSGAFYKLYVADLVRAYYSTRPTVMEF